ncbi:MAG: aldo/keto reductase [Pseudomonadota bacterium]
MEMRELGRTGVQVSAVCLGTMTFGQQNTEAEGHEQMDYARERGVNFVDTAELYSVPPHPKTYGATETIVGNWLKDRGARDKIVLATKITGRSPMAWHRPEHGGVTRHTREQIDYAIENSLRRLQTDYIDLYQLHWPDRPLAIFGGTTGENQFQSDDYVPFEDILAALQAHVDKGNIRHFGVSNETSYGVMRFVAESDKAGLPRVQSIQNAYHLMNRSFEDGLDEIAMRENVGLLAYSPLAQGFLTGKYRNGALPVGSRKQLFDRLQRYETPRSAPACDKYCDFALEQGLEPAALALKFCDTRPFMTSTIIGATTMDQLKVCMDAFDLDWTEDLQAGVDAIHAEIPNPAP